MNCRYDELLKRSLFDLLDKDNGKLNAPDGERWLYGEACRFISEPLEGETSDHRRSETFFAPTRLEMLETRVILNAFAENDFAGACSRLNLLVKEYNREPLIKP